MATALITGSTSGIGAGFASRYARLGHNLVLVARHEERLRAQAAELSTSWRVEVEVLLADLGTDEGCAAVEARAAAGGRAAVEAQTATEARDANERADKRWPIDVLVNNAGFGMGADFVHSTIEDEEQLLRVLVRAPMRITKAALPGMLTRSNGSIITVASVAAFLNRSSYGAAKAWAARFSEGLSLQLAGTGVRAIALCPGLVHTDFHERSSVDVSHAPGWMWLDVEQVVDECLRDLRRGRAVSIPSLRYKALTGVGRHLPPALVTKARDAGRILNRPRFTAGR